MKVVFFVSKQIQSEVALIIYYKGITGNSDLLTSNFSKISYVFVIVIILSYSLYKREHESRSQ